MGWASSVFLVPLIIKSALRCSRYSFVLLYLSPQHVSQSSNSRNTCFGLYGYAPLTAQGGDALFVVRTARLFVIDDGVNKKDAPIFFVVARARRGLTRTHMETPFCDIVKPTRKNKAWKT